MLSLPRSGVFDRTGVNLAPGHMFCVAGLCRAAVAAGVDALEQPEQKNCKTAKLAYGPSSAGGGGGGPRKVVWTIVLKSDPLGVGKTVP